MILSFDTETKGFDWWNPEQQAFLGTIADGESEWAYDLTDEKGRDDFNSNLASATGLIAHNLSFDTHQVRATTGLDVLTLGIPLYDTDLMARVVWPESSYGEHGGFGLKNLAKVYLDPNADTEEAALKEAGKAIGYRTLNKQGAYYDVWRAYPDVLEAYALKDARYTYDLYTLLRDTLARDDHEKQANIAELERLAIPVLIRAEARGTKLDGDAVVALRKSYREQQKSLFDELSKRWGDAALGGEGSEDALLEALVAEGIPLTERTDSGKLSTSQYALKPFASEHPVVKTYLEYRHVEKFLSTYIEPMIDRDAIHPSFRQIGAWTGRMSCMRPNMQNIPIRAGSEVRDVFVARPGHKLIVADYDSIEVRILAYYLGPEGEPYRDLLRAEHDVHAWMAAQLHGGDPADYEKGTDGEKQRAAAKNSALFPIIYGAGGKKLCDLNDLPSGPPLKAGDWEVQKGYKQVGQPSYAQGKALARKVKSAIPGFAKLNKRVRSKIEAHGYVSTILGRKQAVSREKSYVGLNALIQGSAADIMKAGLIAADAALADYDARILLVVHDEVVAEVPETEPEAALEALQNALEGAHELDPPLLTSGTIVDRYGEAK